MNFLRKSHGFWDGTPPLLMAVKQGCSPGRIYKIQKLDEFIKEISYKGNVKKKGGNMKRTRSGGPNLESVVRGGGGQIWRDLTIQPSLGF